MTEAQPEKPGGDAAFDHHSPEYVRASHDMFARLRRECPVAHSPLYGGFYVVTRYDDVARVARDDALFSSEWSADHARLGLSIPPMPHGHGFIEMDPPESLKYRRAINPMFSPAAVERALPMIRGYVTAAIDDFIERGECDIVREFADRIPAMTTMGMLGLDVAGWKRYVDYFHHVVSDDLEDAAYLERFGADNWVLGTLKEMIAERRARPRDDGLTWVINREIDGRPMTDEAAAESLILLMVGGFDTTSALLSNTLLHLSRNPEMRSRLTSDPSLMDGACEEFLRYFSPVQSLARTVTADCQLGGQHLRAGERLLLSWASANLDEKEFSDPEEVRIDRFPNRHQAFGLGTHRCAGSHLARAEFRLAVGEVLRRLPDYVAHPERGEQFRSTGMNNGWFSIPITFTPGRPEGVARPGDQP